MAVLSMLTTYGDLSPAIRDVLLDEADLLLEAADTTAYRSIVDDLTSVWSQVKAPATLNWALQVLDLLAVHPCRDIGARTAFVAATIATAAAHRHRLSPDQAITLDELATELGVPSGLRPKTESGGELQDPLASLAGQRVTLYTLTEPAAIRVRDVLTSYGARVQVRSDHVATPGLRDAVREADIVVMVTRSATHQATDYIRSACPPASLIVAHGKGSSSILCALRQRFAVESHLAA
jgi:hypothetical protein